MNTEIQYNIKCIKKFNGVLKEENISFSTEFDEDGECIDGYSYNPTQGWTNYTNFRQGWSEQDEDLNELLNAIEDYSQSPELDQLVFDFQKEDIGKEFEITYYCDRYVETNGNYDFIVTCEDISEVE